MGSDHTCTCGHKHHQNPKFSHYYQQGDRVGQTSRSVGYRCIRMRDTKDFFLKKIDKIQLSGRELVALRNEINILRKIEFPYILRVEDQFENRRFSKLIFELCEGGDLFDYIVASLSSFRVNRDDTILVSGFVHDCCMEMPSYLIKSISSWICNREESHIIGGDWCCEGHWSIVEEGAARITYILATSLKYLHGQGIVHRDLKPENILLTKDGVLKIKGFYLAHYSYGASKVPSSHLMQTCCGSPNYVAPEVLCFTTYSYECDYWSLGVILYIMLSGYQPFNAPTLLLTYGLIIRGQYKFHDKRWKYVSAAAKDLVKNLMCVDCKKRYTADQIINHAFIKRYVDVNKFKKEKLLTIPMFN